MTTARPRTADPTATGPAGPTGPNGPSVAPDRSAPTGGDDVGVLVGRSVAWSTLDVGIGRLAQFAQGVVVARLLAPEAFGVFAVALVVHAIVINVSELGVSAALVRDREDEVARGAPTVVTISVVSSSLLGAAMALAAPALASALGSPDAAPAVAVMALTLPLAGLSAVPSALLRRGFRMDRLFVANLANIAVTGVLIILLAIAGWGPMALAWSWVAGQLLTTAILLTYRPGRFRPGWDRREARRLLRFGLPLAGANVVVFVVLNVDYVVVGRLLGATALGLYVLAFNISGWPVSVFGSVIRSVSLPGFSRLRLDGAVMAERFVEALRAVARLTIPICFLLGALADQLVLLVYGEQWAAASGALVGLSIMGACRLVLELAADYLVSLGRTRAVLVLQLPWLLALVVALVVGIDRAGIAGAGAAHAVVAVAIMLPAYAAVLARSGVHPGSLVGALVPAVLWGIAAAMAAALVARSMPSLPLAVAGGVVAGSTVTAVANRSLVRAVLVHLSERRRERAPHRVRVAGSGDVAPDPLAFATARSGEPQR